MYLRQLELIGFKSFAKRTTLDFPRGITTIVGPNGAGKSNIVDAIRWVLAEQSFKNLRSKKGEDLIFHGSQSRRALSRSSVRIHFSEVPQNDPLELEEVSIERKVVRGGTNYYLLNGRSVRLVDLETYLVSSAIGVGSFRILSQGMSDLLITLGPQEFREFIEEAAGVKEYQDKKHRSYLKIKSTQQNMEKVSALLAELTPRVNFLKRERNKFEKRHQTEKKLKDMVRELFGFRYHRLLASEQKLARKKKAAQEQISSLEAVTAKQRKDLFSFEEGPLQDKTFQQVIKDIHNLEDKDHELSTKIIILEGKIKLAEERAKEILPVSKEYLKERLASISSEGEELLKKPGSIKEGFSLLLAKIKILIEEIKEGKKNVGESASLTTGLRQELAHNIAARESSRKKLKELTIKRDDFQKKLLQERSELLKKEKAYRQQEEELHQLQIRLNTIQFEEEKINLKKEQLNHELRNLDILTLADIIEQQPPQNIDEEKKQEELWRLKRKMDQIGTIDKAVIEEYEGVQERHSFLKNESADLIQTIASLEKLIKDLDRQIEELFKGALGKVSKSFNNYFRLMFGGGKAALLHTLAKSNETAVFPEGDEPLASSPSRSGRLDESGREESSPIIGGVETRVELPAKKIKSLSNLSGGERTLVSIALLFALVRLRKPAFLVLDEIDAALDEVNSQRFIRLLRELAKATQFIIITHNRETMRGADAIYGISIKEGISHLLSIKLEEPVVAT